MRKERRQRWGLLGGGGARGAEAGPGGRGARAPAAGPSPGISQAAQARFFWLPWKPAGSWDSGTALGGGTRKLATRAKAAQPLRSRVLTAATDPRDSWPSDL